MKFEGKKLTIAGVMVGTVILAGGIALFIHYYPRFVPAVTIAPTGPAADVAKDTGPTMGAITMTPKDDPNSKAVWCNCPGGFKCSGKPGNCNCCGRPGYPRNDRGRNQNQYL